MSQVVADSELGAIQSHQVLIEYPFSLSRTKSVDVPVHSGVWLGPELVDLGDGVEVCGS